MHSEELPTWSSLIFLVPLGLAAYFHIWLTSVLLVAVIIASLAYHQSKEKKFQLIDASFAWLLIFSNIWICYLGNFSQPYFAIALVLAAIALYFYFYKQKRNHPLGHSLWHIFSALITVFSILTFVNVNL